MEHQITVLMGIVEPTIEELLMEFIRSAIPENCTWKVRSVCTLPEIKQAATEDHLDLAVLLLNNIIMPDGKDRVASGLVGVRHLAAQGVPVISLCGGIGRPEVAVLALAAGAWFHFPIPVAPQRFQVAVQQSIPSLTFCPCS